MIYSALFLSLCFDHGNVRAHSHIANDDDRNKHSHLVPSPLLFFITFCRMSTKWGELQHAHEKLFKIPEKWYIRIASTCCTHSPGIIHLKEEQRVEKGEKWVNLSTVFECSAVAGRRHESGGRIGKIYSPSQATWKFQKEKTICSRKTIMWRRGAQS